MDVKSVLKFLITVPTLSGYECEFSALIAEQLKNHFHSVFTDKVGNIVIEKKSANKNAKKLLIDAHIDQIGMMVSQICENGFIRVSPIGGIDARTLPASDVIICGKNPIKAVIVSTPPHLSSKSEQKLCEAKDVLIDTSLSSEEAKRIISVGDAVIYDNGISELLSDRISAPALDNKISAAAAISAMSDISDASVDVRLLLSVREESGGFPGMKVGIYEYEPDYAIVTDVNFAHAKNVKERESVIMGKGPSVSLSALTDRNFTNMIISIANNKGIPIQRVVEASNLGTNGNVASIAGIGAITANISLPLSNMHSTHECASLEDAENLKRLLVAVTENLK